MGLDTFQKALGLAFSDEALLKQALTHRSVGAKNNERLEFLGDAILGMEIAEQLYLRYPNIDEGGLSRYRSALVRKEALAELAKQYDFGEVLILGHGELRSGGARLDSILADAFEAVIGALFLDKGEPEVKKYLSKMYQNKMNNLPDIEQLKDAKTRLQEWLQARKMPVPKYTVIKEKTDHPQRFEVRGEVPDLAVSVTAEDLSRRKAEQKVAGIILEKISK